MAYTVNDRESDVQGGTRTTYLEVAISSLDSSGAEPFDPTQETPINNPEQVSVENPGSDYAVTFDGDNITVHAVADGAAVASGTDVGTVDVIVEGRR